jgi:hypothetical protein
MSNLKGLYIHNSLQSRLIFSSLCFLLDNIQTVPVVPKRRYSFGEGEQHLIFDLQNRYKAFPLNDLQRLEQKHECAFSQIFRDPCTQC